MWRAESSTKHLRDDPLAGIFSFFRQSGKNLSCLGWRLDSCGVCWVWYQISCRIFLSELYSSQWLVPDYQDFEFVFLTVVSNCCILCVQALTEVLGFTLSHVLQKAGNVARNFAIVKTTGIRNFNIFTDHFYLLSLTNMIAAIDIAICITM